jgi:hypothetical protein
MVMASLLLGAGSIYLILIPAFYYPKKIIVKGEKLIIKQRKILSFTTEEYNLKRFMDKDKFVVYEELISRNSAFHSIIFADEDMISEKFESKKKMIIKKIREIKGKKCLIIYQWEEISNNVGCNQQEIIPIEEAKPYLHSMREELLKIRERFSKEITESGIDISISH